MQYVIMDAEATDNSNKAQSQHPVVLFDLDGTLIDHFSAIHRGIAYAQEKLGLEQSSYEKVRATVGGSMPITLKKLCGSTELATAAEPLFKEHFAEIMLEDVSVLPGSAQILNALKAKGHKVAVLTNKDQASAKSLLKHLGLDTSLDAVFGTGGSHPYRKPDPLFTMHALEALDCSSEETLLVGDSPYDYATAEAACLRCYLVATGSHSAEALNEETNADGIFPDLVSLGREVFGLELESK